MEPDNTLSVPCLSDIDQLEDQDFIRCDIDFGMLAGKTTSGFNTKGSPSHESDSGVSDMADLESNLRSVSPSSDAGLSEVGSSSNDLFDFDSLTGQFLEDELDAELASYFDDPSVTDKQIEDLQHKNESDTLTSKLLAKIGRKESSETEVDVESDSSDQEGVFVERKILRPKRQVKFSDTADVHILPSTSKTMPETKTKPAVKVVKVIKTPANTSKAALDNKILEAIDDRSKKNAIQAKMNREKKKAYIKSLEDEIESLKVENFAVRNSNKKIMKERDALQEEVEYLKSVIANQSTLSGLLKNIGKVDNVRLTSSFAQRKRSAELDHDYGSSGKRVKKTRTTAGVCLHVDEGSVSIEFCLKCATAAKCTEEEDS